jgi:hypothetical protein
MQVTVGYERNQGAAAAVVTRVLPCMFDWGVVAS